MYYSLKGRSRRREYHPCGRKGAYLILTLSNRAKHEFRFRFLQNTRIKMVRRYADCLILVLSVFSNPLN